MRSNSVFETLVRSNSVFETLLTEAGYPSHIKSADGSEELEAEALYSSIESMGKYLTNHSQDDLDKACQLGCYGALEERSKLDASIIMDDNVGEDKKAEAKTRLLADLERISKLYLIIGCLHACQLLLKIGDYYMLLRDEYDAEAKLHPDYDGSNPYFHAVIDYWERSAKYLCMAEEFWHSAELINEAKVLIELYCLVDDKAVAEEGEQKVEVSAKEEMPKDEAYWMRKLTATGFKSFAQAEHKVLKHFSPEQQIKLHQEAHDTVERMLELRMKR